jgi:hypothetical protein
MSEHANIYDALAAAQQEFTPIIKDKTNGHFRSKYASLDSVCQATRAIHQHGLSVTYSVDKERGEITATLHHASGQKIASTIPIDLAPSGNRNMNQDMGAALTYGRRYSLSALLNVCPDEDVDGNTYEQLVETPLPKGTAPVKKATPSQPAAKHQPQLAAAKPPVAKTPVPVEKPAEDKAPAPGTPAPGFWDDKERSLELARSRFAGCASRAAFEEKLNNMAKVFKSGNWHGPLEWFQEAQMLVMDYLEDTEEKGLITRDDAKEIHAMARLNCDKAAEVAAKKQEVLSTVGDLREMILQEAQEAF